MTTITATILYKDVLTQIFECLNLQDRIAAGRSNKLWLNVAEKTSNCNDKCKFKSNGHDILTQASKSPFFNHIKKIEFINVNYESDGNNERWPLHVVKVMGNKSNIQEVIFSGYVGTDNELDDKSIFMLDHLIKQNPGLEIIDVSEAKLKLENISLLAQSLSCAHSLKALDVSSNDICDAGAVILFESLMNNRFLTSLMLEENHIEAKGIHALCDLLETNHNIHVINLRNNHIIQSDMVQLAASICQSVQSINLSFNKIGPLGITTLVNVLKSNPSTPLNILKVTGVGMDLEGIRAIVDLCQHNKTIHTLHIGYNGFCTEGVVAIGSLIKSNYPWIKDLNIDCIYMSEKDFFIITNALYHNTHLTSLSVKYGILGNDVSYATNMSYVLQSSTCNISTLSLACNNLNKKALKEFIKGIETNKSLTHLDLSDNAIQISGAIILAEYIKNNSTITSLDISNNLMDFECMDYILDVVEHNSQTVSLKNLYIANNAGLEDEDKEEIEIICQRINKTRNFTIHF